MCKYHITAVCTQGNSQSISFKSIQKSHPVIYRGQDRINILYRRSGVVLSALRWE